MASENKEKEMVEMLQKLQAEIEAGADVKDVVSKAGMTFDDDIEILRMEEDDFATIKGNCSGQSVCGPGRCKPNVEICATQFCEAKHVCGYRCRLVSQCATQGGCYSQPC